MSSFSNTDLGAAQQLELLHLAQVKEQGTGWGYPESFLVVK